MDSKDLVRQMKQYDTGEPVRIQIVRKSNGQAQDLTSATATFLMYQVEDDNTMTELVNSAATVESPETGGYITYTWSAGDTDTVGNHLALFEVELAGGVKESYPRHGYIEIRIESDLNNT